MEKDKPLLEIEFLISNKVRESQQLEYKAAKGIEDKKEITRDVSSFANASGGRIIYGISEIEDKSDGAIPDKIDPISLRDFNHESLEQVINNIQPRITNVKIVPVKVEDGKFIYVVDIPMSDTAHQAVDLKYYRRYNFQRLAMFDYEIKDIMNRAKHPNVALKFFLKGNFLTPALDNNGKVLAKYVRCIYYIPTEFLDDSAPPDALGLTTKLGSEEFYEFDRVNKNVIHSGIVEFLRAHQLDKGILGFMTLVKAGAPIDKTAPPRKIRWEVYADNAEMNRGELSILDCLVMGS